jgi:transposase-like protein
MTNSKPKVYSTEFKESAVKLAIGDYSKAWTKLNLN